MRRIDPIKASKFTLKEALLNLGPEGFTFEDFIAKIFEFQGFDTRLRTIARGRCVNHEIDIIAGKIEDGKHQRYMIECKYHNLKGIYTGLKETMYTHARFQDLNAGNSLGLCEKFHGALLITNTKFSGEATGYAECVGLKLMGWNYPPETGLQNLIDSKRLYPITVLKYVNKEVRKRLSHTGLIILNDIVKRSLDELRRVTGITPSKIYRIKKEAEKLIFQ